MVELCSLAKIRMYQAIILVSHQLLLEVHAVVGDLELYLEQI